MFTVSKTSTYGMLIPKIFPSEISAIIEISINSALHTIIEYQIFCVISSIVETNLGQNSKKTLRWVLLRFENIFINYGRNETKDSDASSVSDSPVSRSRQNFLMAFLIKQRAMPCHNFGKNYIACFQVPMLPSGWFRCKCVALLLFRDFHCLHTLIIFGCTVFETIILS